MDNNYMEVVQHISEYFKEHLPKYTPLEVRRQSYNTEDHYLYMVAARKDDDSFAIWTSWNESIQSLNCGHYDLPSLEACVQIMTEYQCGSLYAEESSTPLEVLQELLIKNDDSFESSYQELLYIRGYADGINAQQEHNWKKMADTEINILLQKAVEV